jgi:glycosyltransferase involved in cell wall biosynthesis
MQVAFVIPIYNDWHSARLLLAALDAVLARAEPQVRGVVYLVDDGSKDTCPLEDFAGPYQALETVTRVRLKINLGHQRAIACGLVNLVLAESPAETVIVMDGDGEDRPEDVPRLLKAFAEAGGRDVVFAQRGKRQENVGFKLGYIIYKTLFTALTGTPIRFGNFSVLHREHAEVLVLAPELWLNYPATIKKRRLPFRTVLTDRGKRLAGDSRMNINSLITHGLSAMAVNNEVIGTRLLLALTGVISLFGAALAAVVGIRLFVPSIAVPGWASYTTGLLAVLILNSLTLGLSFVFSVLGNRTSATFLPQKDALPLIGKSERLYGKISEDPLK